MRFAHSCTYIVNAFNRSVDKYTNYVLITFVYVNRTKTIELLLPIDMNE